MLSLNKLNDYNRYLTYLSLDYPSAAVFVPLIPQNNSTIYELLPKLHLIKTNFRNVYIPQHRTNVQGVKLDTVKTYEELLQYASENKWVKLFKPIKTLPENILNNLIVDLFPVYNQLSKLFERYKENPRAYYDLWFKILIDEINSLNKKLNKPENIKQVRIVPILVSNINSEQDLEKIQDFYNYLKLNNLKFETVIDSNFYYVVPFINKPIYSLLAHNKNKTWIFNVNAFRKLEILSNDLISEISNLATKVINQTEKEDIANTLSKYFENSFISKSNIENEEEKNQIIKFFKSIVSEYIEEKNIVPKSLENVSHLNKLILEIIKDKLNLVNTNIDKLSESDIVEILRRHIVVPIEIQPKAVDERFNILYSPDKNLETQSTVVNLHKKEFTERIDRYVRTLLQTLEDTFDLPIKKKIKNITRQLVDDKLNRYWLYTVTIENTNTGETYDLQIKIPALINDRYFKLNGKTYVLAAQRFLKPITVTDKNKARLLTYYAIVTLSLRNFKLSLNDVNEIIEYIIQKYPKLIDSYKELEHPEEICPYLLPIKYEYVKFKDGTILYGFNPQGAAKFLIIEDTKNNTQIIYDAKNDRLIFKNLNTNEESILEEKLNEFLLDFLITKIQKYNPKDILSKTSKFPYVEIYLGGFKMPYILFLFGNFGIQKSLEKLGIDYSIDENPDKNAYASIPISDNRYVNLYPSNVKEKYIVNGIFVENNLKLDKYNFEEFENNQLVRDKWLDDVFGEGAARINLLFRRHMIDPVTKEILKAEGKSTTYFNILTNELLDTLFNSKVYKPTDLKIHRVRLSEVILHILYKQIAQAKHELEKRIIGLKKAGKDIAEQYRDKYYLDPDYIIKQLLQGESLLQYTEPVNPIDELNVATRITPKGIGGLPGDAITLKHRLIPFERDPKTGKYVTAHFQNISALDTNEYSNVGSNNQLTWDALISDKYGFFLNKTDLTGVTFETLGIGESLAPYIQSIDHDRTIKMAQQLRQTIPINNPDVAAVMSGSEFLIPQVVSQRFAVKAEKDGKVINIEDGKYITVQYDDGTQKVYNIMPRLARIKRGIFMPVKLTPLIKKGDRIQKGSILAAAQQLTKGIYAYGKNVAVALFTYRGKVYEDGWAVSESVLEQFAHKRYVEVIAIVPPDTVIEKFTFEENTPVKFGDVLLQFKYNDTLENYFEQNNLTQDDVVRTVDDIESLEVAKTIVKEDKSIKIKAPADGVLKEVRIYINGKAPKEIESVWKRLVTKYRNLIDYAKEINGEDDYSFEDTIDTSMFVKGKHTYKGQEFKGALVMFLIEVDRIPTKGDKFVFRGGNKGVITGIIPKGKEPISEITKIKIDWVHNPLSNIGRKNTNFFKEIQVGKIIYFLNKRAKEMAEDPKVKTEEIKKFVTDVYSSLVRSIPDTDKTKQLVKNIVNNIINTPNEEFRKMCQSIKDPKHDPIFVWIALPFTKLKEQDIKYTLVELMGIPLLERMYIPELKAFTERPIAIGFGYVTILEHMPDIMMGYRSRGKYTIIGQGAKGQSKEGEKASQSLDTLTLVGLLDRLGEDSEVVKELFTVQADDHLAKNYVMSYIINTGKAPDEYPLGNTGSKNLMKVILYGLSLDPGF